MKKKLLLLVVPLFVALVFTLAGCPSPTYIDNHYPGPVTYIEERPEDNLVVDMQQLYEEDEYTIRATLIKSTWDEGICLLFDKYYWYTVHSSILAVGDYVLTVDISMNEVVVLSTILDVKIFKDNTTNVRFTIRKRRVKIELQTHIYVDDVEVYSDKINI
jgi:uncharacterized protein YcfL